MTWAEFKKRAEELGVEDDQQIGIDSIDDNGLAHLTIATFLPLKGPIPMLPVKKETGRG